MGVVAKLTRDLTKHRGKAALLGTLFVTMLTLSIRAFLELHPAAAAANAPASEPATISPKAGVTGADADERIRESKELWRRLKEVKQTAVSAREAFTFDCGYYPPPAVAEVKSAAAPEPREIKVAAAPPIDEQAVKANRIREQARALVVKSTAIGDGTMEPMAIVNQQLVTVGQKIQDFEVSAIRAREVVFVKEGVTTVVRMPDGQ
jgi:hypothetical protein